MEPTESPPLAAVEPLPQTGVEPQPRTGAASVLAGLKDNGVDYLFANAGTDFPPIIEALAQLGAGGRAPAPVTVPHETASVGMAHGFYLVSGRPQAMMVHVNVGLANAAMGAINAAGDNIPVLLMSGRTPITEAGRPGGRRSPIQYGQEMYDQSSLVRDVVKFHYEMRYPEQGAALVSRAITLAMSEPRGPVYLSLPREPLTEDCPADLPYAPSAQQAAQPAAPAFHAIEELADMLASARSPLIICQRGDVDGAMAAALSRLAGSFALPVVEPFSVRNVMASADPMFLGYSVEAPLAAADVVLVLDAPVPWIESRHHPAPGKVVVHLGPDPLFQRMPVRGFQTDRAIVGDPVLGLDMLYTALDRRRSNVDARRQAIATEAQARRVRAEAKARRGGGSPMSAEWVSLCVSEVMDDQAIAFNELGLVLDAMDLRGANRVFSTPHTGGLGWAMPAALGAQLADRDRLCIACVGDGSYMFANPAACHQIAEAMQLPILTIVKNNGMWNAVRRSVVDAYPEGVASSMKSMPLTSLEPSPDYTKIACASRAHVERVVHGEDLPAALERAVRIIRAERRQALLELSVEVSDQY